MNIDYILTEKHSTYNIVINVDLLNEYNLDIFNENYALYVNEYHKGTESNFKQLGMAMFLLSNPLSNELPCDIILVKNTAKFIFKCLPKELVQSTLSKFFNIMTKKPSAKSLKAMKDKTGQLMKIRFSKLDGIKKSEIPFKDFFLNAFELAYKSIISSNILIIGPEIKINEDKIKINELESDKITLKNIKLSLKKPKFKILKINIGGSNLFKYIILNLAKMDLQAKIGNGVCVEFYQNSIYAYTNDHINLNNSNLNELTKKYTEKFKEPKLAFSDNDLIFNMIIDNIISSKGKQEIKTGDVKLEVI